MYKIKEIENKFFLVMTTFRIYSQQLSYITHSCVVILIMVYITALEQIQLSIWVYTHPQLCGCWLLNVPSNSSDNKDTRYLLRTLCQTWQAVMSEVWCLPLRSSYAEHRTQGLVLVSWHTGRDEILYRTLWGLVRTVPNLALGKKKSVQERFPGWI